MNIKTIEDALELMSMDDSKSQPLIDAINANAASKAELEGLFYKWCWQGWEEPPYEGDALAYSIELGRIEEFLVSKGLIYQAD